jgi:hypothetical protein
MIEGQTVTNNLTISTSQFNNNTGGIGESMKSEYVQPIIDAATNLTNIPGTGNMPTDVFRFVDDSHVEILKEIDVDI